MARVGWAKRAVERIWDQEETPENRYGTRAERRGTSRSTRLAREPRTDSAKRRRAASSGRRYRGCVRKLETDECTAVDAEGADFGGVLVGGAGSVVAVCGHVDAAGAAVAARSANHAFDQRGGIGTGG